jgi:hypothetical protein
LLTVDQDHRRNFAGVSSCFCAFLRAARNLAVAVAVAGGCARHI